MPYTSYIVYEDESYWKCIKYDTDIFISFINVMPISECIILIKIKTSIQSYS